MAVVADGYHWVKARDLRVRDEYVCDWDDTKETREWERQVSHGEHPEYIPVNVYETRPIEWLLYKPPAGGDLPEYEYSRVFYGLRGVPSAQWWLACQRVRVVKRTT